MPPYGKFNERISNTNKDAIVWRYLDLAKFMDLFVKRRIYFRRSDLFDDVFEGMPTTPLLNYIKASFQDLHKEVPGIWTNPIASAEEYLIEFRQCNFINSWYLSDYESAAMWTLYSKIGSGIAIRSTVERLRDAIPADVYVGKVLYVDYEVANIDSLDDLRSQFFLKRNLFEHEKEIRVLYSMDKHNLEKTGHYIEGVDLGAMIEKIVLSPKTASWFQECVKAFLKPLGFDGKVELSALETEPPIKARPRPEIPA